MNFSGSIPESPASGSPSIVPRCRHFGICGGCATQDVAYPEQLARKEAILQGLLGAACGDALKPITPSPAQWFYRNKMECAFGFEHGELAVGLRQRGRFFSVVNLTECYIMSEALAPVLAAARDWGTRHGFPPYHLRRHQGFLRYMVLREGKRTGDRLAMLVTAPPPDEAQFQGALDELGEALKPLGVTSLLWSVTDRKADLAVGEVRRAVFGPPSFEEVLGGTRFNLSPYAFFQPNVEGMDLLIEKACGFLGAGWDMVVDLYCGVGGLSFPISRLAKRVIGVESEGAAVQDAGRNAGRLGVGNCQFVAEDSLAFLRRFSDYSFLADKWAVVLDPPRAGMHPKMPGQLLRVAPPVIIYVSCNPKMLAGDLAALAGAYRVDEAVPYDFFPQTPHMEVLARLVRK